MNIIDRIDLFEYIFNLPDKRDRIITLCFVAGYTQIETAKMFNLSQSQVSRHLKIIKKVHKKR